MASSTTSAIKKTSCESEVSPDGNVDLPRPPLPGEAEGPEQQGVPQVWEDWTPGEVLSHNRGRLHLHERPPSFLFRGGYQGPGGD